MAAGNASPRRGRPGRTLAGLALIVSLAGALAACGTTVSSARRAQIAQLRGYGTVDGLASPAAGTPVAGAPAAGPAAGPSTDGATTDSSGAGAPTGSQTTATAVAPVTGGAVVAPVTGGTTTSTSTATKAPASTSSTKPGHATTKPSASAATAASTGPATGSPVEVGLVYIPDADAFAKLQGGKAQVGDQQKEAAAVVAYLNQHGGFNGHVIVPDYYSQSITNTSPYSTFMASICSAWTEDHHVVAGMFIGANVPNDLAQCLSAKGVTYLSGGFYLHDQTDYAQLPYMWSPYEAGSDRVMKALIKTMLGNGFLSTKDKVGVMLATNEPAAARAYSSVVVPMLKAANIPVASYGVDFPSSTADIAGSLTQESNDEVHMRADGVTLVMSLAPSTIATTVQNASGQKWFPKYAVTSWETPWAFTQQTKINLATQTGGVQGIGWEPTVDVGTYGNSAFSNPTRTACKTLEDATGQMTNNQSDFAAYQWCDGLFALADAARAAGTATVTSASLTQGFAKIGNRESAMVLASTLSASQHDGASVYRPIAYQAACNCFAYTGSITPFS